MTDAAKARDAAERVVAVCDVLADLAKTDLDGGYRSTGLQLVHRQRLTDKLQVIAQAGVEFYNSQIADSPIARDDFEAEVSLALVWVF